MRSRARVSTSAATWASDHVWIAELAMKYRWGAHGALRFVLQSYALDGTTTLSGDVLFNGATLAGGTTLETRTHFPSFLRATLTGERELAAVGRGRFSASAGLTFVSLMFELQGTLAPTTASQETHEDFVTQELPVPVLGLALAHPLTGRLDARASALVGYLPWVNSLRHEGGVVSLRQRHLEVALDLHVHADLVAARRRRVPLRLVRAARGKSRGRQRHQPRAQRGIRRASLLALTRAASIAWAGKNNDPGACAPGS